MSTTPPPIPPPTLTYQTPVGLQPTAGTATAWRKGNLLVTPTLAALPDQCVKCGQPGDGRPITKAFYWHPPVLALMIIFPGLLIYAIVALCVRKKATLTFSVCAAHRRKRRNNTLITAALILAAVGCFLALGTTTARAVTPEILLLGGILVFLGGLIYGLATIPVLRPSRIDNQFAQYKGCSPQFLSQF